MMGDREITVTLTEDQAKAIIPSAQRLSLDEWNVRADRAEEACERIRQALAAANKKAAA